MSRTRPGRWARWLAVLLILTLFSLPTGSTAQDSSGESGTDSLTVALTGKYPPFSFYDETGQLAGFDVDVSGMIAGDLGADLEIVAIEWDGILAGLLAGKYDAIIGSMAVTPERMRQVDFSTPYYKSGAQLFIHDEDAGNFQAIEDMAGQRVGVVLGETFEHYLKINHPEIEVVTYKSSVDIFQDMQNRRLSGFVTDRLVGMYQIKSAGMPFLTAGPLLYEEKMAIPVCKDRPELLAAINSSLQRLENDGELEGLLDKWFAREDIATQAGEDPVDSDAAAGEPATPQYGTINTATVITMLAKGFGITLIVAVVSLLLGFVLALPIGVLLYGKASLGQYIVRGVVDFIRGTPVLIQLFFVYFGGPQIGLKLSPLAAAIITLTINSAAYISEVVRSGLLAVGDGQRQAARALGLSPFQVFSYVVWPQAFRVTMPPLMNSAVALLKDTALISVISVAEVIREAQSIISVTFQPMKFYFIVAVMFFVITYPLMRLAAVVESRLKERGFSRD